MFKDATDIVTDRDAMRSRLRDEGCLFFHQRVSADEVLAVREEVLSALDTAGWLDANADRGEARPSELVRFERDSNDARILGNIFRLMHTVKGTCGFLGLPRLEAVAKKYSNQFPKVKLFTLAETVGDWQKAQKTHFADGGVFDQIYQPNQ